MLAEWILNIPATSAPAEQVFSAAANIINIKRARLTAENANVILFLKENEEYEDWIEKKVEAEVEETKWINKIVHVHIYNKFLVLSYYIHHCLHDTDFKP